MCVDNYITNYLPYIEVIAVCKRKEKNLYSTSCISQSSSNKQAIKSNPIPGFKSRSPPHPPLKHLTLLQWIIQLPVFIHDNCPNPITDYPEILPTIITYGSNREPSPSIPPSRLAPPNSRSINSPEYNPVSIKNPPDNVFIISVFSRQTCNEKDFVYDCTHTCGETM